MTNAKINKRNFEKRCGDDAITIISEFTNECGEKFVIFKNIMLPNFFITGDEFDWETTWVCDKNGSVYQQFYLCGWEEEKIKSILKDL